MNKTKTYSAKDMLKEWRDYEEIVTYLKKNFDAAVKKTTLGAPSN
ncbi:unnamed protein product [marine sediment metagenome]|uniref:Uncharacterized protein n=1 Tax=marine sediment metagenome TaxID=412755 RepID=X1CCT0_9ZZZZ